MKLVTKKETSHIEIIAELAPGCQECEKEQARPSEDKPGRFYGLCKDWDGWTSGYWTGDGVGFKYIWLRERDLK